MDLHVGARARRAERRNKHTPSGVRRTEPRNDTERDSVTLSQNARCNIRRHSRQSQTTKGVTRSVQLHTIKRRNRGRRSARITLERELRSVARTRSTSRTLITLRTSRTLRASRTGRTHRTRQTHRTSRTGRTLSTSRTLRTRRTSRTRLAVDTRLAVLTRPTIVLRHTMLPLLMVMHRMRRRARHTHNQQPRTHQPSSQQPEKPHPHTFRSNANSRREPSHQQKPTTRAPRRKTDGGTVMSQSKQRHGALAATRS